MKRSKESLIALLHMYLIDAATMTCSLHNTIHRLRKEYYITVPRQQGS